MKTLSIQQPWASLIATGIKDVEVRSWDTSHIGKILIHASSKKVTASLYDKIPMELSAEIENAQLYGLLPFDDVLPTSAIIGYVEISDCVQQQVDSLWSGCDSDYNWIFQKHLEIIRIMHINTIKNWIKRYKIRADKAFFRESL